MKILAIYSGKGGVGKTATAVNLSFTAARSGAKVLLSLQRLLKLFKKKKVKQKKIVPFFSMVEKRKTMHSSFLEEYREHPLFLFTQIPFMAEIEKMGMYCRPVGGDGKASPAAEKYQLLWNEIIRKGEKL